MKADVQYRDEDLIVFRNRLTWLPTMLLVVPVRHMTQSDFWQSDLFARAANLASRLGETHCQNGYRILSNFGDDALQTQAHAHLHVIGGANVGLYADFKGKDQWVQTFGEQFGL